jgi:hypothetical protein
MILVNVRAYAQENEKQQNGKPEKVCSAPYENLPRCGKKILYKLNHGMSPYTPYAKK